MAIANGDATAGPVAVAAPGPVLLVRYRQGVVGETTRTVHVVSLPPGDPADVVEALCGAVLTPGEIEAVAAGEGMPCILCLLHCVTDPTLAETQPPHGNPDRADTAAPAPAGLTYQYWGWPVTLHHGQARLSLDGTVSALMIPTPLCTGVIPILTQRRCAPPVLAHPYAPGHHIVLTGEKYGIPLPWPEQVHQVTGVLLLPPTPTPRGPVTWITTPQPESLHLCREIDLFAALRSNTEDRTSAHLARSGQPEPA